MAEYSITDINVHRRINGVAGQYSYVVEYLATITDETSITTGRERVQFVGNEYSDSVIVISSLGMLMHIDKSVRDAIGGRLSPEWIRRYLSR